MVITRGTIIHRKSEMTAGAMRARGMKRFMESLAGKFAEKGARVAPRA
jgi:hypothetical protein